MDFVNLVDKTLHMKSTPIVKILTVSGFTLLIICFVCYRVGAFDNFSFATNSSENYYDGNNTQMAIDTPIVAKDSVVIEREIMPSSKMMVMPKPKKTDTVKKTTTTPADTTKKKPLKKSNTMSSSKSGIIYEPEPEADTTSKPKK